MAEFTPKDIFGDSVAAYIDYCSKPQIPWEYLERPMWELILEDFKLSDARIIDIGSGAGNSVDLLIKTGAKPRNIFALEPNSVLAQHLYDKYHKIGVGVIVGSSAGLGFRYLQNEEFDMISANMVANHLTTPEYDDFIKYARGMLMLDGFLIYTTPFPEEKSKKHGFDCSDNYVAVAEPAPWGGMVKYNHRSEEYQTSLLENNGFEVKRYLWGYENFLSDFRIHYGESKLGKSLRGPKRLMFVARKIGQ